MELNLEQKAILLNLLLEKIKVLADCKNPDEARALEAYKEKIHTIYGLIVDSTKASDEAINDARGKRSFDKLEPQQDLTEMKTTKAFRSDGEGYVDTAWCPYCNAENTGDIVLAHTNQSSGSFDTDEANAKIFECTCYHCGLMFRVDYFREV